MKKGKTAAALLTVFICAALLCGCIRQKPEDGAEFSEHSELGIEKKERRKDASDASIPTDSPESRDETKNADAPEVSAQTKK